MSYAGTRLKRVLLYICIYIYILVYSISTLMTKQYIGTSNLCGYMFLTYSILFIIKLYFNSQHLYLSFRRGKD